MAEDNKDEILTINQCAQLLKVSPWTIYALVSDERIPGRIFANKVGRSWRILRSEVDNFLLREKVGAYQMSINQTNKK
ncbi:MAG: helix-turn-helix transcriptional regulator [Candidatus Humimicrobiaceae bacterium]